jgi:cytochrome c
VIAPVRAHLIAALSGIVCLLSSPSAQPQTEPASEQQAFNNACRTCHVTREGDNRLGPNLHKIVGRKAGSLPNYSYSSAMKEADFVWDEARLDRFIASPDEVVPGNKMKPYGGLANKEDREKIVAFLAKAQ